MGTDSLFMPRLTASDIKHGEEAVGLPKSARARKRKRKRKRK